jgi:hypothetical protein
MNTPTNSKRRFRRILVPAAAAVGAAGLIAVASAATLGGITSEAVGADDEIVVACDSDGVTVDYDTAYNSTTGNYVVTDVTVADLAAGCISQDMQVTLIDSNGDELEELTATVAGASETMTLVSLVEAERVTGVAVVIEG